MSCSRRSVALAAALGCAVAAAVAVRADALGPPNSLRIVDVLGGLSSPLQVTSTPSQPNRLYVVEQGGKILVADGGKVRETPFLDISGKITSGGERGLLSVAFHPNYAKNHRLYADFTDLNGNTRVVEYRSDASGERALPGTARLVFAQPQPYSNHNGGQLAFGPDGLLYIGLGDGGSEGDPHDYGQTLTTKLAKIWKLDVDRKGAKPQLFAYGLRNPWRFSFDRATGDLYIGDVGQDSLEEVDYVAASDKTLKNFGWPAYEGTSRYSSAKVAGTGVLTRPIAEYSHRLGCSVSGGFVYRGRSVPAARGRYFYGDYCSGRVWSLRVAKGKATDVRGEPFRVSGLSSFGESASGELYLVSLGGTIYRLTY